MRKPAARPAWLVTGAATGFGKACFERFGGSAITLETSPLEWEEIGKQGAETLIHCAFNPGFSFSGEEIAGYAEDNILLTDRALRIPHGKFVLISSVDVYPLDERIHQENEALFLEKASGPYAAAKMMAEALTLKHGRNPLVLRCSALLGRHARKGSLMKLLEGGPCSLRLSGKSVLNCVRHEDVIGFMAMAVEAGVSGVFNAVSSKSVSLSEAAALLGVKAEFGGHEYRAPSADGSKISSLDASFKKSSGEVLLEIKKEWGKT